MLRHLTNALMLFAILGLVTPALAGHMSDHVGHMSAKKLQQSDDGLHTHAPPIDHLHSADASRPDSSLAKTHGHHQTGSDTHSSCCKADCNCPTAHCQVLVVHSLLLLAFEHHSLAVDTYLPGAVIHTQETLFRPPAIV